VPMAASRIKECLQNMAGQSTSDKVFTVLVLVSCACGKFIFLTSILLNPSPPL